MILLNIENLKKEKFFSRTRLDSFNYRISNKKRKKIEILRNSLDSVNYWKFDLQNFNQNPPFFFRIGIITMPFNYNRICPGLRLTFLSSF